MVSSSLTIVIPVSDDEEVLSLLRQIERDSFLSLCEIIVILNQTPIHLEGAVKLALRGLKDSQALVINEKSISRARNIGISQAKGEWLVFLDSDCMLNQDYGLVLQNLLSEDHSFREVMRGGVNFVPRNSLFSRFNTKMRNKSYALNRSAFYAPNLVINRRAFEEFGPLSTEMRYGIDAEWGRRAQLYGSWLRFVEKLKISHLDDSSRLKTLRTWHYYGVGRAYREKRHFLLGGYTRKKYFSSLVSATYLFDKKKGLLYNLFVALHYLVRTTGVVRGVATKWESLSPANLKGLQESITKYKNNSGMTRCLLLDVGGVILLDSKPQVIQSFSEKNGFEVGSIYELLKTYRQEKMLGKDFDLSAFLLAKGIDWISAPQLTRLLCTMWNTEKPNNQLIEAVSKLKKQMNFEVALVTNNYKELLEIMERKGIKKFWDKVVNSSEIGLAKPDPEFFKAALAILQARPENCLFIDDNLKNIAGATSEGITGIVYQENISVNNKIEDFFTQSS